MRRSIRELRQDAGVSQSELAEKVGVSQAQLSGWETGRHVPGGTNLRKVADALGVDMSAIAFGGEVTITNRERLRAILQAELDGESPAVFRTDAGIFIRPTHKALVKATVGYRRVLEDYLVDVSQPAELPLGSLRRGARLEVVRLIPSATELPA